MLLIIKNANIKIKMTNYFSMLEEKKNVKKSKIVKTIYLRFGFLKKRFKLLIAALTKAAVTNIKGVIIDKILSINRHIKNKR